MRPIFLVFTCCFFFFSMTACRDDSDTQFVDNSKITPLLSLPTTVVEGSGESDAVAGADVLPETADDREMAASRLFLVANVSQYDPKGDTPNKSTPVQEWPIDRFDANFLVANGVEALIARATTGSGRNLHAAKGIKDTDAEFSDFIGIADKAGMLLGAYHLLRPSEDGKEQARHFLATIKAACQQHRVTQPRVLLVLDAGYSSVPERVGQSRSRVNEKEVVDFLSEIVLLAKCQPLYYPEGGSSYSEIQQWSAHAKELIAKCPLWIPNYSNPDPIAGRNILPWGDWLLHQYGGSINGRASAGENTAKFYYHSATDLPIITRNEKIVPLEISIWHPSIANPKNVWAVHSVAWQDLL